MRLLLDTHAVLWSLLRPEEIPRATADAIRSPDNEVFVSAASAWEIAIKVERGKLRLPGPPAEWLPRALSLSGYEELDVRVEHALAAGALPPFHRDPFDRLLVAQAKVDRLSLVTRDGALARYGVDLLPA